jgi:hypothetical protein
MNAKIVAAAALLAAVSDAGMAGNHGSSFRGPRSFFYEGHEPSRTTGPGAGARKSSATCSPNAARSTR